MVTIRQPADHKDHKIHKYNTLHLCSLFYLVYFVVKMTFDTASYSECTDEHRLNKLAKKRGIFFKTPL